MRRASSGDGRPVAVIDIGKTNAKVVLVAPDGREMWERRTRNAVLPGPPYTHHDAEGLWAFALAALSDLPEPPGAIVPVTHGACAALVDAGGALALPVLDYEHPAPSEAPGYAAPPFAETGSPPLPDGLNLGRQLHWQAAGWPDAFARARFVLTWPQWWAFRLSGVAASEVTSLGCHTDLWAVHEGRPSSLARARVWDARLPPLRRAGDVLGPILPEVATQTGLPRRTPVMTGIHDSNASLLPYLGQGPCGVLSTGTWIVAMALGTPMPVLDPARDMLVNAAADGRPVPTARFMGGRERDAAVSGGTTEAEADEAAARRAAGRLAEIGAAGPTFVEGPFAASMAFRAALEATTGQPVRARRQGAGTTLGAAMLAVARGTP